MAKLRGKATRLLRVRLPASGHFGKVSIVAHARFR